MSTMTNIEYVWNNGVKSKYLHNSSAKDIDEIDAFKKEHNATRVIGLSWRCGGRTLNAPTTLRVLADETGYVHCEGRGSDGKALIVMNADDTHRLTIPVPRIDDRSRPEKGYMVLPPSSASFGGIRWGVEGNDGFTDYLFQFDWNTGELIACARPTRSW
ncbi:MAG: hypothetical protein WKG03_07750 [Telluria sp.]